MFRSSFLYFPTLAICAIPVCRISGQQEYLQSDARSAAIGFASAALSSNQFTFGNPAAQKAEGTNLSFSGNRMTSWSGGDYSSAGLLTEAGSLTIGAGVWRFGDAVYNRQIISGLMTHGITHTRLGVRLDLNQFTADGQPVRRNMSFSAGGITNIHSRLTVGAFAENPGITRFAGKPMAIRFSAGLCARPLPHISVVAAVMQEVRSPASLTAGLEYAYRDQVFVRMGSGVNPYRLSCGAGFSYWRVRADFAAAYAYHTGLSVQATASVRPYTRKK